jgi:hypothetical protein
LIIFLTDILATFSDVTAAGLRSSSVLLATRFLQQIGDNAIAEKQVFIYIVPARCGRLEIR